MKGEGQGREGGRDSAGETIQDLQLIKNVSGILVYWLLSYWGKLHSMSLRFFGYFVPSE